MARQRLRFDPWIAIIAALLSLLGSLLAPAVVRLQANLGLFPGPAAPGFGLPFADPLFPFLGALACGLGAGLLPTGRPLRLLPALLGSSGSIIWGMLWGGGLTERGLWAAGTIGLLAAGYVLPLQGLGLTSDQSAHRTTRGLIPWAVLLPHLLCLLFLVTQTGFSRPFRLVMTLGLAHALLVVRDQRLALSRPVGACLFLLQSAILVLGTALWPQLPGR